MFANSSKFFRYSYEQVVKVAIRAGSSGRFEIAAQFGKPEGADVEAARFEAVRPDGNGCRIAAANGGGQALHVLGPVIEIDLGELSDECVARGRWKTGGGSARDIDDHVAGGLGLLGGEGGAEDAKLGRAGSHRRAVETGLKRPIVPARRRAARA